MADRVLFLQILDTKKLKKSSSKPAQWQFIEDSINAVLPLKGSTIMDYKILPGTVEDFGDAQDRTAQLVAAIRSALTDAEDKAQEPTIRPQVSM